MLGTCGNLGDSLTIKPDDIRAVFADLSTDYDRISAWLSWGRLSAWQRALVQSLEMGPKKRALDVCTGTGEVALALAARGMQVTAVDFCAPMLDLCRQKSQTRGVTVEWLWGDALALPLPDDGFDGATVSFALRNLTERLQCFSELARVVRPGGRLALLELSRPQNPLLGWGFDVYSQRVVPALARRFAGTRGPGVDRWDYFFASLKELPAPETIWRELHATGWERVCHRHLMLGAVRLYVADRKG